MKIKQGILILCMIEISFTFNQKENYCRSSNIFLSRELWVSYYSSYR